MRCLPDASSESASVMAALTLLLRIPLKPDEFSSLVVEGVMPIFRPTEVPAVEAYPAIRPSVHAEMLAALPVMVCARSKPDFVRLEKTRGDVVAGVEETVLLVRLSIALVRDSEPRMMPFERYSAPLTILDVLWPYCAVK